MQIKKITGSLLVFIALGGLGCAGESGPDLDSPDTPRSPLPADLAGEWFTGTLSSLQYYDSYTGEWQNPSGEGNDGERTQGQATSRVTWSIDVDETGLSSWRASAATASPARARGAASSISVKNARSNRAMASSSPAAQATAARHRADRYPAGASRRGRRKQTMRSTSS